MPFNVSIHEAKGMYLYIGGWCCQIKKDIICILISVSRISIITCTFMFSKRKA